MQTYPIIRQERLIEAFQSLTALRKETMPPNLSTSVSRRSNEIEQLLYLYRQTLSYSLQERVSPEFWYLLTLEIDVSKSFWYSIVHTLCFVHAVQVWRKLLCWMAVSWFKWSCYSIYVCTLENSKNSIMKDFTLKLFAMKMMFPLSVISKTFSTSFIPYFFLLSFTPRKLALNTHDISACCKYATRESGRQWMYFQII